jgi:hypothetical protein
MHHILCAVVGLSCRIMVQYIHWHIMILLITHTVNKSTINSTQYSKFRKTRFITFIFYSLKI